MMAFVQLEASQPGGKTYRLSFGVFLPQLASMVVLFSRLF
jgi:hypothetical protein